MYNLRPFRRNRSLSFWFFAAIILVSSLEVFAVSGRILRRNYNVRSGPSTDFRDIGSTTFLRQGTIRVTGRRGRWYRISSGSTNGWVHRNAFTRTPTIEGGNSSSDLRSGYNVRSGAGTNYRPIGSSANFRRSDLRVLQLRGRWYRISAGGRTGWVHRNAFRRAPSIGGQSCDNCDLRSSNRLGPLPAGGGGRMPASNYRGSSRINRLVSIARSRAHKRSTRYCYRYVKVALRRSGLVSDFIYGVSPRYAGPQLERRGFRRLNISQPRNAPRGAVLVYSGGSHGHISIKTAPAGQHGYVSDFVQRGPATTWGRRLIGVYYKE